MEKFKGLLQRGIWCLVLMLLLVFAWGANGAFSQDKETGKQITVESLQDLTNPNPPGEFKVELAVDRGDATYKVGDQIVFTFKTNKDCRLTLFNVGTSGKVHVIFPNASQQDNLVKAGTEYRVPPEGAKFAFKAASPAGDDYVKAIATLENVTLIQPADLKPAGPFQEVAKAEKDIVVDMLPVLVTKITEPPPPVKVGATNWTETGIVVKIVE
jgi:hypothetical protein